jgi:urease subunit beta
VRPGEILPGDEPVPRAPAGRRGTVRIRNRGQFPAYIGSHFPLERASDALDLDPARANLAGARLDLPAGESARIGAGEEVELPALWT